MQAPQHLLDVWEIYVEFLPTNYPKKRADKLKQETWCTFTGSLLIGLGYKHLPSGTKPTKVEVQAAREFMKTQKLAVLLNARIAQQQGFELVDRSQKMLDIYQCSLDKFLIWCGQQSWWPGKAPVEYSSNMKELCCSNLRHEYGSKRKKHLTHRRGRHIIYKLKHRETSPQLQAELDEFYRFLTEPEYPLRVSDPIKKSCATKNYLREVLLFLGWFYHFENVPVDQLSLELLLPKVRKQDLRELTETQQKKLWKQHRQVVEGWLNRYFTFLRESMQSVSPRTKNGKLNALSALGKFQYHTDVEVIRDYEDIPVLQVVANQLKRNYRNVSDWNRNGRYVADQDQKWPDVVEGQTALKTICEKILEPLRLECRPKNKNNKIRKGSAIAKSEQQFLAWFFLAGMPARRQEEYRDLKLALCCPIERPSEVPLDGVYHPLPPNEVRDQRHDGTLEDNYIYKTYVHQGRFYKQGLWILDIQEYKMQSKYGPQSIVIKNRRFEDGTHLYDYFEHYLYGWWLPGGRKKQHIYDWWQQNLMGRRGQWISKGRASFEPCDACYIDHQTQTSFWAWGYFFMQPIIGFRNDGTRFEELVEIAGYHYTGKQISPHTMRAIWATWAYQMRLTDQQKSSLAYAMGHDIETLKELYERSSADEKRRPIEEAIDQHFFEKVMVEKQSLASTQASVIEQKLLNLSPAQRCQLAALMAR